MNCIVVIGSIILMEMYILNPKGIIWQFRIQNVIKKYDLFSFRHS